MRRILQVILTIFIVVFTIQTPSAQELDCSERVLVNTFDFIRFEKLKQVDKETVERINDKLIDNLGEKNLVYVDFHSGFMYDKENALAVSEEQIKRMPKFILNYHMYDRKSKMEFCFSFWINSEDEIAKDNMPVINETYHNDTFISQKAARALIKKSTDAAVKEHAGKTDLEKVKLFYNRKKQLFEWQFGDTHRINVEAIEEGKIELSIYE